MLGVFATARVPVPCAGVATMLTVGGVLFGGVDLGADSSSDSHSLSISVDCDHASAAPGAALPGATLTALGTSALLLSSGSGSGCCNKTGRQRAQIKRKQTATQTSGAVVVDVCDLAVCTLSSRLPLHVRKAA